MIKQRTKIVGVVLIATRKGSKERRLFLCDHASVGRSEENDLILAGDKTSPRHGRFHYRKQEVVVVDLRSKRGIALNGARIGGEEPAVSKSRPLRESDVLAIGDWEIRFVPDDLVIETQEERTLFDAIANEPSSDDVRQVYGDWLEERGRTAEAELIAIERLSASLAKTNPRQKELEKQRRELCRAPNLRASWRAVVTRPKVIGCDHRPKKECPGSWDRLTPTDELRIRTCAECSKHVYFITDPKHAERQARRRQCVVLDPGVE